MTNIIRDLFAAYIEDYREQYVIHEDNGAELNAFINGVLATLHILDIDPDAISNNITGETIGDNIEDILVAKSELQ